MIIKDSLPVFMREMGRRLVMMIMIFYDNVLKS